MNQPSKFTPVIISSVVIVVIALFPFLNFINMICCAGVIIGGGAGTMYYNNQLKKSGGQIQYKDGAAIGILSGIISALIVVIASTLMTILIKNNPIPEITRMLDSMGLNVPAEYDRFLQKVSEEYDKHGFSITITLISLVTYLIVYPLFSTIGGMLAVAISVKKKNTAETDAGK